MSFAKGIIQSVTIVMAADEAQRAMLKDTLKSEIEQLSEPQLERLAVLIEQMKAQPQLFTSEDETPFWQRATPQERAEELLRWSAQQSRIGINLPDEAFDRATIYD